MNPMQPVSKPVNWDTMSFEERQKVIDRNNAIIRSLRRKLLWMRFKRWFNGK